jgi:LysR family transcriptional activator of nhaA
MGPLNYQHLLYFWTVAREGSITRATRRLHLTQPTISAQLRTLEHSLGETLFERRGRSLVLTDAGQTVFRYADEIFSLGRELAGALEGRQTGRPLRFAVGVSDSLPKLTAFRLLEPAFATGAPAPGLRLVCRTDRTDRLAADLAIHALDLVIADTPVAPTVRVRAFNHLLGDCGVTIFATPARAAAYRRRFPRSLDGAPFLLHSENSALRRSLDAWFVAAGVRPEVVGEVEDVALLQAFGQAGLGLFAAPSVVEAEVRRSYGVRIVGRLPQVRERFYAISVERKITHPGVAAILAAARHGLFSARPATTDT